MTRVQQEASWAREGEGLVPGQQHGPLDRAGALRGVGRLQASEVGAPMSLLQGGVNEARRRRTEDPGVADSASAPEAACPQQGRLLARPTGHRSGPGETLSPSMSGQCAVLADQWGRAARLVISETQSPSDL